MSTAAIPFLTGKQTAS